MCTFQLRGLVEGPIVRSSAHKESMGEHEVAKFRTSLVAGSTAQRLLVGDLLSILEELFPGLDGESQQADQVPDATGAARSAASLCASLPPTEFGELWAEAMRAASYAARYGCLEGADNLYADFDGTDGPYLLVEPDDYGNREGFNFVTFARENSDEWAGVLRSLLGRMAGRELEAALPLAS